MSKEQIALTLSGLIFIPLIVAGVRFIQKTNERLTKSEAFQDFLKLYLLKDAVLTYHNNPNPETDKIIEKIVAGESVSDAERKKLEQKIQGVAENAGDKKKQAKAENTLELMRWVFDEDFQKSVNDRARAKDLLFSE